MVADSAVFISHKQSGALPDRRETAEAMIVDELRYMKTRHYFAGNNKLAQKILSMEISGDGNS